MADKFTVAVLGGGNGAFAHAGHLALKGFKVNLFEVPEFENSIAGAREKGGIEFRPDRLPTFPKGFAPLNVVSTDPSKVVPEAEVVWIVIPAFAQKSFAEICAPHFRPEQIVVLSPGNGGALEFVAVLKKEGVKKLPKVAEAETMLYFTLKEGVNGVYVSGFKEGMGIAALPGTDTPNIMPKLQDCFPSLVPMRSVLETQLSNVNLVVHAPILLLNSGRAESKEGFEFYHEGSTFSVGKILEAVDRERVAVGKALGLDNMLTLMQWEIKVYGHQGCKGKTLAEVLSGNPAYRGRRAPQRMDHRFITEDVPYGMVPVEQFGALCGVPTPIISALITIGSEMLGVDLRRKGRDWKQMGIAGLGVDQIKELVGQVGTKAKAY